MKPNRVVGFGQPLSLEITVRVLAVMGTCDIHNIAGQWLDDGVIPAKSGLAGGVMAVTPGRPGIATYSPLLDNFGNSVRGVAVCRQIADLEFLCGDVKSPSTRLATFGPGLCSGEIGFIAQACRMAEIIATEAGSCWALRHHAIQGSPPLRHGRRPFLSSGIRSAPPAPPQRCRDPRCLSLLLRATRPQAHGQCLLGA
jgi:hypothetical protein